MTNNLFLHPLFILTQFNDESLTGKSNSGSAAFNFPAFETGYLTNTGPAILLEAGEILETVDIGWSVLSLLFGCSITSLVG